MSAPAFRTGPLRVLPRYLFDTQQPRWLYLLKVLPLTLLPSLLMGAVMAATTSDMPEPEIGSGPLAFVLVVLFAPFAETLLMTPPVLILDRLLGPVPAVLGSALLWGVLHSLAEPGWGLIIWWPFLIFSTVLLVWRSLGIWSAMLMVALAHALHNLLPSLTVFTT